jgi:D-aspartate ligase
MPFDREFKNPALILGGELAGLQAARILGKRGVAVYVFASYPKNVALASRYCKRKRVISGPWDCDALKKMLKETARATSKRLVVYPVSDELALNLSIIKDDLPDDFCFAVGDRHAVETLINKRKFYQLLSKNKIAYPVTYFPDDLADADRIASEISYPIFIKPSYVHLFHKAFGYEKKGFVANSREELLKYYRLVSSFNVDVVFQRIVSGPPSLFCQLEGFYNRNSEPLILFGRRAVRIWPLDFGNTTLCSSISLSDLVKEIEEIDEFLKSIKYNGMMSVDFKRDPLNGKLQLLEINTRLWMHFWLPTICGVDILFASYLDALGEKVESSQEYTTDIKSIDFISDLKSAAKMIRLRKLGFSEYTSSLMGKKVFAYYDRKDIRPFIHFYLKEAFKFFKRR